MHLIFLLFRLTDLPEREREVGKKKKTKKTVPVAPSCSGTPTGLPMARAPPRHHEQQALIEMPQRPRYNFVFCHRIIGCLANVFAGESDLPVSSFADAAG